MSNLTAFLIIAVICLVSGRRYDLCRIILFYYIGYFMLWPVSLVSTSGYYVVQMCLDILVILVCCKISYFYKWFFIVPVCYAIIIFTSLMADGLKFIDEAMGYYAFTELHKFRQSYSIPLDIIFAMVGSNGVMALLSSGFRRSRANIAGNSANGKAKPT